jgi:hypothetical protein
MNIVTCGNTRLTSVVNVFEKDNISSESTLMYAIRLPSLDDSLYL